MNPLRTEILTDEPCLTTAPFRITANSRSGDVLGIIPPGHALDEIKLNIGTAFDVTLSIGKGASTVDVMPATTVAHTVTGVKAARDLFVPVTVPTNIVLGATGAPATGDAYGVIKYVPRVGEAY